VSCAHALTRARSRRRSYRKLALQLHPDKNRAAKAEEAFKLANKARTQKRICYTSLTHALTR
jgi:preprotein translocase subunit Sec63